MKLSKKIVLALLIMGILVGCKKAEPKMDQTTPAVTQESDTGMVEEAVEEVAEVIELEADTDGDGVVDSMDQELNTPKGVEVDENGVALDSDGDGIADYMDREPMTPKGIEVDENGVALDSDEDGVADYMDQELNTPKGAAVDANGVALDSDGDGVIDFLDEEPNTLAGAIVDENGRQKINYANNFKINSAELTSIQKEELDKASEFLDTFTYVKVRLIGHASNEGTEEFNQTLSEKRAINAKKYLNTKGISDDRISNDGKGENFPLVSNDSLEGRQTNRRVEIYFYR